MFITKQNYKIVFISMLGNALEFYEFSLYGAFAPIIAKLFFPQTDPFLAILASLGTFATGFIVRPLGAILYGHIGDKWGRKKALSLSILLMSIPTTIVGLLPSYEVIGLFAPTILILCRILQGLCAAGEYNGSAIFIIEHIGKKRSGLAGSLVSVSGGSGALLAMVMGTCLLNSSLPEWLWRIPFLMGASLALLGFYIRYNLPETPEYLEQIKKIKPLKLPLKLALQKFPIAVLCCIGGAAFSGSLTSTFITYLNVYLSKVIGLSIGNSMFYSSCAMLMFIIGAPLAGALSDRFGQKKIMTLGSLIIFLTVYPLFLLIQTGEALQVLIAHLVLGFNAAWFIAPLNAFMNNLFSPEARYSGIAFGYGTGMALLGGTMPFISASLIHTSGNIMAPAFYLMIMSLLGLLITYLGSKKSF